MNKLNDLRNYVASLDVPVKPSVHVNGGSFHSAVLTVDFGQPLEPLKLTSEQVNGLTSAMREAARQVARSNSNVRINADSNNGLVYWASL